MSETSTQTASTDTASASSAEQRPAKMAAPETVELRVEALREAASIISNDRNVQYGGPEENFQRIADLWSLLFGIPVSQEDVAMAMVAMKMARYMNRSGGFQRDTWIDIAGYAGCGYEVGMKKSSEN